MEAFEALRLSESFNVPIHEVADVRAVFEKYDYSGDGELDPEEFHLMLRSMLKKLYPSARDVPRDLFARADRSSDGKIDFEEFMQWYSMNSFAEKLLLNPEQQKMRDIARRWDAPIAEIEQVKRAFDSFDSDGSGLIDFEEFGHLLRKLLKVPAHAEVPENRLTAFWKEIDADGSGEVDFEEFVSWYRKYFDMTGKPSEVSPMELFYAAVRGNVFRQAQTDDWQSRGGDTAE